MAATYTRTVNFTGDANPNGDNYTWVNVDSASWVTIAQDGTTDSWNFTIQDWTNPNASTRSAQFKVQHWLWSDDTDNTKWDAFTIIQYATGNVEVTTTAAPTPTAATTTQATTLATTTQATTTDSGSGSGSGTTTQATTTEATTTEATTTQATTTQATTTTLPNSITLDSYTVSIGNAGGVQVIGMDVIPTDSPSKTYLVAYVPPTNPTSPAEGTITFWDDDTGTGTQVAMPSWISNVSGQWTAGSGTGAGSGYVQFEADPGAEDPLIR